MPNESVSVYLTLRDGASSVLSAIGDKTKTLTGETQSLSQAYSALKSANEPLISKQSSLKAALEKSAEAVKTARSEFRKLGDEASESKLSEAIDEQDALKRELKDVEDQLKSNQSAFSQYRDAIRKGALDESGLGGGGQSLAAGLASSGIFKQLSSAVSGLGSSLLTSGFDSETGTLVSDTISGALAGAAAGMIAGPLGAAVGALAGSVAGLITAGTKVFEAKDDAFKSYYQEAAQSALDDQTSIVSSGSEIAGSREQTQIAFAQRFGGDEAAAAFLDEVKDFAADTNYSYDEITGYAKSLLNTYDRSELFDVLTALSDALAGLNLSSSDVSMFISGLSRMRTTNKATQEYLNYFSERGVDVYQALADSTGADKSAIADMVTGGDISGTQAAEAILTYINQEFGGLSEKLAGTYDAMADNLADAEANLQEHAGAGYNEERGKGIAEQTAWYEDNEDELGEAYSLIGQWQASLENSKEKLEREALNSVLSGAVSEVYADSGQRERLEELAQEYQQALQDQEDGVEGAGARMGALLAEAQVIAQNEYNASEGAQLALEAQLSLAAQIRDDASSDQAYWDAGYRKGQAYSAGLAAGVGASASASGITGAWTDDGGNVHVPEEEMVNGWTDDGGNWHSFAVGLDRVPYDNFPALLHEGERVQTAAQARSADQKGGAASIQITISGNSFTGAGEDMAEQVAQVLAQRLEQAQIAAAPR